MREITFTQALDEAIAEEMRRDAKNPIGLQFSHGNTRKYTDNSDRLKEAFQPRDGPAVFFIPCVSV